MAKVALKERVKAALQEQWARRISPVVTVYLPFPISVNRLWKPAGGKLVRTARYETWARAAGIEINRQRLSRIKGAFNVRIVLERNPNRRRIDADNGCKCLLDILQEHRVIENDSLVHELNVSWSEHMKGAYVVLTAVASGASGSVARRVAA